MSSKAARIRELYAQGLGTGEIAKIVGCKPEYVRVAGRQRKNGRSSQIDIRYLVNKFGDLKTAAQERNAVTRDRRIAYYRDRRIAYYRDRRRNDPEYRAMCREWERARRARLRAAQKGMEPSSRIV